MTNYRKSMSEVLKTVRLLENYRLQERELTDTEAKRREEIAQSLDDDKFKKQYGERWKQVKMAVATDMAKKEEVVPEAKISSSAIANLKKEYDKVQKIDPTSPAWKKVKALMDKMDKGQLMQIVDAKIKFLRIYAAGKLREMGVKVKSEEAEEVNDKWDDIIQTLAMVENVEKLDDEGKTIEDIADMLKLEIDHVKGIVAQHRNKSEWDLDEEMKFKVKIEGLPDMYIDGKSAGGVKAQLKKIVRKPDSIQSVDRITAVDLKKDLRKMIAGKEDEKEVSEAAFKPPTGEMVVDTLKSKSGKVITITRKAMAITGSITVYVDGKKYKNYSNDKEALRDIKKNLIKEEKVDHQLKIAIDTVKNPNKGKFLGGPSAKEAEKTLRTKYKYTDKMIAKLKEEIELDEAVDVNAADELKMYIENDAQLYKSQLVPIVKNMQRKMKSGKYDHKKAPKLWMYLVDAGAKKYVKEFGGDVRSMFDKQTRQYVAQQMADEYKNEIEIRGGTMFEEAELKEDLDKKKSSKLTILERINQKIKEKKENE
tara:strand:- start:2536 stop:4146 length:1611 start_codon:yes stop_codon:yes gene_type:complete